MCLGDGDLDLKGSGNTSGSAASQQQASQQSHYENMQITSVLQPYPCDKDHDNSLSGTPPLQQQNTDNQQSCLVCIARRISVAEKTQTTQAPGMLGVEQFTTKQDLHGKILACDTR